MRRQSECFDILYYRSSNGNAVRIGCKSTRRTTSPLPFHSWILYNATDGCYYLYFHPPLFKCFAHTRSGSFPLTFPIRTVWFSSLFLLIGGGQRIFNSLIFTLVSNALDEKKRRVYIPVQLITIFNMMLILFSEPFTSIGLLSVHIV